MPIRFLPLRARRPRVVRLLRALPAAALLASGCTERATSPRAPAPAQGSTVPTAVPATPTATAPASEVTPTPKAAPEKIGQAAPGATAPLTVTLAASDSGRQHVRAGSDVTLTAFTALPRGRSATLTLFYQQGRGRRTVFSFAQGSLCSATWFARAPGRYRFTATALDDRHRAALSRSVDITVDGPVPRVTPLVAAVPPPPVAARPSRPRPPRAPTGLAAPRPAVAAPVRPPIYHVVAARFAQARNADVLAAALRGNGYHATARRMADGHGQTVYVVETGTYRRPAEVFGAVSKLLRSGYPAYFYAGY